MHYIGQIQYWANTILGKYNIGRIRYWANTILGECDIGRMRYWANTILGEYNIGRIRYWANTILGEYNIGRIQYWANPILGECDIGQIQYWGECDSPLQLYAHISVGAYRIRPFAYALLHTPHRIHPKLHYYNITCNVFWVGSLVWLSHQNINSLPNNYPLKKSPCPTANLGYGGFDV